MSWYDEDKYRREGEEKARLGYSSWNNPYDQFESPHTLSNRHDLWDEGHRQERRRQEERREEEEAAERATARRRAKEREQRERQLYEEYERLLGEDSEHEDTES